MPYRIKAISNNYYHLYNRGNNFENIFFEHENYRFFLNRVIQYFDDNIEIIAYVLMPNHFHFIVKPIKDDFLEKAMQKLSTSYTKAINLRMHRVGHVFQGRYKLKLVPVNNYLLHLSRYIHLNPVRKGLVNSPLDWQYSSYNVYTARSKNSFIKYEVVLNQIEDYEKFVKDFQEQQNYFVKKLLF